MSPGDGLREATTAWPRTAAATESPSLAPRSDLHAPPPPPKPSSPFLGVIDIPLVAPEIVPRTTSLAAVTSGTLEIWGHSESAPGRQPVPHDAFEAHAATFRRPPSLSQNAPEFPAASAPSPPASPSHPEPLLLNSVTFTSSVSSHLLSPVCSPPSSGPPLITPPQTLSPPPTELTPPPAQQLGSDDEEQEDPTDYCKGERSGRESGP